MRKPKKRIMLETENPLMTTIAKGCCIGTPAPIPGDKGRSAKATANDRHQDRPHADGRSLS